MRTIALPLIISCFTVACAPVAAISAINPAGNTLAERILPPPGFKRDAAEEDSFAAYARALAVKPHGAAVRYYDGAVKDGDGIYCAVLDLPLGNRNLQQCADAAMRLRAEYLFARRDYADIAFSFIRDGKRRSYIRHAGGRRTYASLQRYLDHVYEFANTASLFRDTRRISAAEMQPGDIFLQKGRPYGHAVIIMDMATNDKGRRIFLLAQSYMPAQDIQILINPNDESISPWYALPDDGVLITPEWEFAVKDLRRFVSAGPK